MDVESCSCPLIPETPLQGNSEMFATLALMLVALLAATFFGQTAAEKVSKFIASRRQKR